LRRNARYPADIAAGRIPLRCLDGLSAAATAAATADIDTRTKVGLDFHLSFLSVFAHECALSGRRKCRPNSCQPLGGFKGVAGSRPAATAAATAADQHTRTKVGLDLHLGFLSVLRMNAHYPAGVMPAGCLGRR
jgi:hypothetical protein